MQFLKVFDPLFRNLINDNSVDILHCNAEYDDDDDDDESTQDTADKERDAASMSCATCKIEFADAREQRAHYKLDWHRFNLKQRMKNLPPISQDVFDACTEQMLIAYFANKEFMAIIPPEFILPPASGRLYLTTKDKRIFLIYKCLLADKREEDIDVQARLNALFDSAQIAIILLGGGHFAAAIFKGSAIVKHQTKHCYAVRAGQGGLQLAFDNKRGASKSAGAQIRRQTLQAFTVAVRTTLEAWDAELRACAVVLCSAPGPFNKSILYGDKPANSPLRALVRAIPISTRKPTLMEVKRVYEVLTNICVFDSLENAAKHLAKSTTANGKAKGKELGEPVRSPKVAQSSEIDPTSADEELEELEAEGDEDSDDSYLHEVEEMSISFMEVLQQFDETPKKAKARANKERQKEIERHKARCKEFARSIQEYEIFKFQILLTANPELINAQLDDDANTALHICALAVKVDLMEELLNEGADLCAKNAAHQTPYSITKDATVRNFLKSFAKEHPDMFNYSKAQIPVVVDLTPEQLAAKREKHVLAKRAKREKEKVRKKAWRAEMQEAVEKERFLLLSDREKRALAAERRMTAGARIRCFTCAEDVTGKIVFEYAMNRFCSIDCLKKHRVNSFH